MKITVINDNIGEVPSDALITTVNSSGLWFGAIDGVIAQYTTNQPHLLLGRQLPNLSECNATSVPAEGSLFRNIIFVIDNLVHDLWVPIYNALDVAEFAKYKIVTIPTVRYGVMLGIKEKTKEEYLQQFAKGIKEWVQDNDNPYIKEIRVVVYNDYKMSEDLQKVLKY